MIAAPLGPRAQAGKVGTRIGFRKSLTPDFVASKHSREVALALLVGTPVQQSPWHVVQCDKIQNEPGRASAGDLFIEDNLLRE